LLLSESGGTQLIAAARGSLLAAQRHAAAPRDEAPDAAPQPPALLVVTGLCGGARTTLQLDAT
jgi:hypothetical protein